MSTPGTAPEMASQYPNNAPISVVIPAFNADAYIEEAIASVRSQTTAVQEIIVVDDGSRDATAAKARATGVVVLEQENAGVSVARNRGIQSATQPWIALLDADDVWQPDKISRQWSSLQKAPDATFSFCDYLQFDEHGIRNQSVLHEIHTHFESIIRTPIDADASICDSRTLAQALLVQNIIQPSALLIRRDTIRAIGGFDAHLLACQDYDFSLRLSYSNVGTYIDSSLVRYRRHGNATTHNIPKSREGLAGVARRAITFPWEYSPNTIAHFRHVLPSLMIKCAFAHIRYGQSERARTWLRRSLCERFNVAAIILYSLTYVVDTEPGRWLINSALQSPALVSSLRGERKIGQI
jgi:glycosyltransferase involved in cell wall biosynthesis